MTADRQSTPQDAPRAPVSDFQAPQAPGDGATAPDAASRLRKRGGYTGSLPARDVPPPPPTPSATIRPDATEVRARDAHIKWLEAQVERLRAEVIRVNDRFAKARQANTELRAEVEHLNRAWRRADTEANEALGHVATLRKALDEKPYQSDVDDALSRATAAAAESARLASVVAKVEALADGWAEAAADGRLNSTIAETVRLRHSWSELAENYDYFERALRAALASVAPDTATPGEVCSTCGQSMDSPPCSRSADGSMSGHTIGGGANKCEATR